MDELMTVIPFKGCQLKWAPHEPWGVPADELIREFKPSVFTSGYVKSESLLTRSRGLACTNSCTGTMLLFMLWTNSEQFAAILAGLQCCRNCRD